MVFCHNFLTSYIFILILYRIAYRRAIAVIKSLKKPIEIPEDAENIPGIGKSIKDKIVEIITTGML